MSKRLRCAIYTRKSTEEGLDQQFNSLHAQREACEAYVLSQAGEGWSGLKTLYDDGGYSGGSMERPGLKQLLTDIGQGHVDIVVVYKVDRLTRSLADFAKIVELFDSKGVSFVSVTQAFNTTTSMGRLTLNVLLSFAQFEREVTGERIRDKVAASKAKGLRMGGNPPLGYDIVDGRLAINQAEACVVRRIFERYLELGSVLELVKALRAEDIRAKHRMTKAGTMVGGGHMGRGPLHYLLTNPAYRGVTRHKDKRYPNTHPAIIDEATWDRVQASLSRTNARQPRSRLQGEGAMLQDKLFDDRGHPMAISHAVKGARRYRYYISRAKLRGDGEAGSLSRISAGLIEQFLVEAIRPKLSPAWMPDDNHRDRVSAAASRIVLSSDHIQAALRPQALGQEAHTDGSIRIPFHMGRGRGGVHIKAAGDTGRAKPRMDRTLIRALVLARLWARRLETGEVASVRDLAAQQHLCKRYTARLLPLAYLAPDLVQMILEGRQPRAMTLKALTAGPLPASWEEQRRRFA